MENAADALKMAGFMLIFVAALSLAMTTLSKAKSAATAIIYSNNKRNDYSYLQDSAIEEGSYDIDSNGGYRIVGIETIIPTIYNYSQETYRIEFYDNNREPLEIVPTNMTKPKYKDDYNKLHETKKNGNLYINFFDLALEGKEASDELDDKNVGSRSLKQIEDTVKELQTTYKDAKFAEQISEKRNVQQEKNEADYANGDEITKAEEDKANDKVKIISYKLLSIN